MRLIHPGTNPITVSHWYMLELRSEKTSEETIKRLGKTLRKFFQQDSAEIFVPIKERDLDTFTLLTECYIFVRANDVSKIAKLRSVTGVQGVVSKDESLRPNNFIKVEDAYVQDLIQRCWDAHHRRAAKISVGSWVRILDGQTRNYCGLVLSMQDGRALVKVDLKTKVLTVDTSVYNLLDLSHVPQAHRVFYYSEPVVQFLRDHGATAEQALEGDLQFNEEALQEFLTASVEEPDAKPSVVVSSVQRLSAVRRHTSREQTPTRFVESLMLGGERDIKVLLAKSVEAIRAGTIRRPQTALILWHIIRTVVIRTLDIKPLPGKKAANYTQVKTLYGDKFDLTPTQVHEAIPELPFKPGKGVVTVVEQPVWKLPTTMTPLSPVLREQLVAKNYRLDLFMEHVELGLKAGAFRAPKSLDSLVTLTRRVILNHFKTKHRTVGINALVNTYGEGIYLTIPILRQRYPNLEKTLLECRERQTPAKLVPTRVTIEEAKPLPVAPKPAKRLTPKTVSVVSL